MRWRKGKGIATGVKVACRGIQDIENTYVRLRTDAADVLGQISRRLRELAPPRLLPDRRRACPGARYLLPWLTWVVRITCGWPEPIAVALTLKDSLPFVRPETFSTVNV
jgi:hypothetical protein